MRSLPAASPPAADQGHTRPAPDQTRPDPAVAPSELAHRVHAVVHPLQPRPHLQQHSAAHHGQRHGAVLAAVKGVGQVVALDPHVPGRHLAGALAAAAEIAARGRLSPAGRLAAHNLPLPPSPSRFSGLQQLQQQQLQEQAPARHPAAPQFGPGVRMLLEAEPGPGGDRSASAGGRDAPSTPRGAAVRVLEKPLSPGPFAQLSAGGAAAGAGANPAEFSVFGEVAPEVALVLGSRSVVFDQSPELQAAPPEPGSGASGSASGGLLSLVPGLQAIRSRMSRRTEESPRRSAAGYGTPGSTGSSAGLRPADIPPILRPSDVSLTQLQESTATPNVSVPLDQPQPDTQEQELLAEGAAGSGMGSGLFGGRLLSRLTGRSGAGRSPTRGSRTESPRRRELLERPPPERQFDPKEE